MEFSINYNDHLEQKQVVYCKEEYSFDTIPYIYEIDFDIALNTITLTVVDGKVIQLNGFCGLSNSQEVSYVPPVCPKGLLKVVHSETYIYKSGSFSISNIDWPISINSKIGWICIGNPQARGNAVEFIENCISVIDDNNELVALWLHPYFV